MKKLFMIAVFAFTWISQANEVPQRNSDLNFSVLSKTPVLNGGRLKPFDEYARESILFVTGSRSFGSWEPSEVILSWILDLKGWGKVPLIKIQREELKKQLLLPTDRSKFSLEELMTNPSFLQYAESAQNGNSQVVDGGVSTVTNKKDPRQAELNQTISKVSFLLALSRGENIFVTPKPEGAWGSLAEGIKSPSPQSEAFHFLLKAYLEKNSSEFANQSQKFYESVTSSVSDYQGHKTKINSEVIYNRLRPFLQAMILYLFAGLFWAFSAQPGSPSKIGNLFRWMAKFATIFAFSIHTFGFALRCYISGRPPVSNMYESMIWVSFGVLVFAFLLNAKSRNKIILAIACFAAGLVLLAADSAPVIMDPTIHPLVAVLRSNYWLTVHVLTITLSYAAFLLASGIANTTLFQFWKDSQNGSTTESSQKIAALNNLTYRCLQFGTVLLAAGTILGGIWADASWGRFWGWDPKEVWALIALLTYLAVLHGRFTGWIDVFTFPMTTTIAFSTVVMAWYGVNFILGTGKHSYGFSSGGQGVVATMLLVQFVYAAWIWFVRKRKPTSAA